MSISKNNLKRVWEARRRSFRRTGLVEAIIFIGGLIALSKPDLTDKAFGIFALLLLLLIFFVMTKKELEIICYEEAGEKTIPDIEALSFIRYTYPFFGKLYRIDYSFVAEDGQRYFGEKTFAKNFFSRAEFPQNKFEILYKTENPTQHFIFFGKIYGF